MYLPYSHQYAPGYLAWRLPEFRAFFDKRYVQLPLAKGDAAFFNPALFHGAGNNVSADVQRMANLLQVSSAFGRAMETVDRVKVSNAVYPALRARRAAGVDPVTQANAISCAAEGYPFPSNLDLDENLADSDALLAQAARSRRSSRDTRGVRVHRRVCCTAVEEVLAQPVPGTQSPGALHTCPSG